MAEAKICGIKDAAALNAAIAGRARFIGLVFHEKSPRFLELEAAAALAEQARGRTEIVALTVDSPDPLLQRIAALVRPDYIQAHGRETPNRLAALRPYAGKGVIKALGVAAPADLDAAYAFEPTADILMFDAKPPAGADRPGGHGAAFDWTMLAGRRFRRPWLLAGGLNPDNVGEAVRLSGAALVDVSSGVESAPGVKDPARIARFLDAARGVRATADTASNR